MKHCVILYCHIPNLQNDRAYGMYDYIHHRITIDRCNMRKEYHKVRKDIQMTYRRFEQTVKLHEYCHMLLRENIMERYHNRDFYIKFRELLVQHKYTVYQIAKICKLHYCLWDVECAACKMITTGLNIVLSKAVLNSEGECISEINYRVCCDSCFDDIMCQCKSTLVQQDTSVIYYKNYRKI